jgi:hypothetical protein
MRLLKQTVVDGFVTRIEVEYEFDDTVRNFNVIYRNIWRFIINLYQLQANTSMSIYYQSHDGDSYLAAGTKAVFMVHDFRVIEDDDRD